MSEYDDYEHGDYLIIITPDNINDIAEAIREARPEFPIGVYYNLAEKVMGEEMLFSEFVDKLHKELQDEIDRTLVEMVSQGQLEMSVDNEGDIILYNPESE